ncbi:MAG: RnfABCDGE type electron transport complex subunit D, partial [Lachnospiraceae bacterium]|nr:RnfABCDGE type electron transport complex subunit D [Lachnospiraceae bacterium]
MSNLMNVSAAPHVRSNVTTASIMRDVAIALAPTLIFGIWNFNRYGHGLDAFILILICVVFCVATEFVYEKLMKKPVTIGDFSAVVTGLILALNLPATLPYWIAALGSIFAILVVKMVYGGLGQNFMNPALGARCFLVISFARYMTNFDCDAFTGPTPLALIK